LPGKKRFSQIAQNCKGNFGQIHIYPARTFCHSFFKKGLPSRAFSFILHEDKKMLGGRNFFHRRERKVCRMFTFKWVWQNFKGYHGRYITALVMQIVISAMVVITPSITGRIIDRVVVGVENAEGVVERHPE